MERNVSWRMNSFSNIPVQQTSFRQLHTSGFSGNQRVPDVLSGFSSAFDGFGPKLSTDQYTSSFGPTPPQHPPAAFNYQHATVPTRDSSALFLPDVAPMLDWTTTGAAPDPYATPETTARAAYFDALVATQHPPALPAFGQPYAGSFRGFDTASNGFGLTAPHHQPATFHFQPARAATHEAGVPSLPEVAPMLDWTTTGAAPDPYATPETAAQAAYYNALVATQHYPAAPTASGAGAWMRSGAALDPYAMASLPTW